MRLITGAVRPDGPLCGFDGLDPKGPDKPNPIAGTTLDRVASETDVPARMSVHRRIPDAPLACGEGRFMTQPV